MPEAKIQHYVPKFLLRNFGTGKKNYVWVYDKLTGRSFQSNVKNVASENRFYDFEVDGENHSLEATLCRVESAAKPIVQGLVTNGTVAGMSAQERGTLAAFLAIQFVRTQWFRAVWAELPKVLRKKAEALGTPIAPGSQAEALTKDPTENEIKIDAARMLLEAPETYGPHFLDKTWFVARTTSSHPFVLGDNPVSLQNHVDTGPYGNLGLAVQGIQIYLPLSSTRALAMWCPSIGRQIADGARTIRSLPEPTIDAHLQNPQGILELDAVLRNGSALNYSPEHVLNFNSLQIIRSERYVFSTSNDFSLAKRMINDHPHTRFGQKMATG